MLDWYRFIMDNLGTIMAIVFLLVNFLIWMSKRVQLKRSQERYGHYPPAVRSGRLDYEDYKRRREG